MPSTTLYTYIEYELETELWIQNITDALDNHGGYSG